MAIIRLENMCCGYGSRTILHDISFTVEKPEYICVVGPNGVGKSTLIRTLNGLLKPSSGIIELNDRPLASYTQKEVAKIVGYVPVLNSDFNIMTVLETVLIGRYSHQRWRTTQGDLDIAYKALQAMEIEDLAQCMFNELSAGQKQKVSIARGLVQEPSVLMLDEPTANLDIRHQVYVSAFLKELSERTQITVFTVSHDLNLASKYADRIILMERPGKICAIGTPQEIITRSNIRRVYGVDCTISDDMGTPHVVLQDVLEVSLDRR
ncbi:MAG: ABC transporter ATP-binding protein [archaeon]|nr:ABC transporter ATP-binding protein [archaeon]